MSPRPSERSSNPSPLSIGSALCTVLFLCWAGTSCAKGRDFSLKPVQSCYISSANTLSLPEPGTEITESMVQMRVTLAVVVVIAAAKRGICCTLTKTCRDMEGMNYVVPEPPLSSCCLNILKGGGRGQKTGLNCYIQCKCYSLNLFWCCLLV